jgi:signal transduction histidine kinase
MVRILAATGRTDAVLPVGSRLGLGGRNVVTTVRETGRPARIDSYAGGASGPFAAAARERGIRSSAGTPILVEGHLWGLVVVGSSEDRPLPPDTEARLGSFTELVATAIANVEGKSELAASRRRIVAASDEARRRIEHDLHDGTQQRLVSLALAVRAAEADVPSDREDLRARLSGVARGLSDAVEELREISRGIHPAILSEGGLGPALRALARRSATPVAVAAMPEGRFPEPIEVAAYFVTSEALANATKHARASRIELSLADRDGVLLLSIHDDGAGGADPTRGSGLVGLADRVEALGGSIRVESRAGEGTRITAELPVRPELDAG